MSKARIAGFEDYHNVGIIYSMSNFGVPQADGFGSAYYKQSGEMYGTYTDNNGNYVQVQHAHTDTVNGVTTIETDNTTLNGKPFPGSFTISTSYVPSAYQTQNNINGANAYILFSFNPAPEYARGIGSDDLLGDPRSTTFSHTPGQVYYSFEFTITDDSSNPNMIDHNSNFAKLGLYLTASGGTMFFKPGVFYDKATSASFLHDTVYRFSGSNNHGNLQRQHIKKGKNRFDFSVYFLQSAFNVGFFIPTEPNQSLWVNGQNRWNGTIKDISIKRRVYDDNRAINNPVIPEETYYYYSGGFGIGVSNL